MAGSSEAFATACAMVGKATADALTDAPTDAPTRDSHFRRDGAMALVASLLFNRRLRSVFNFLLSSLLNFFT
jgi:hypothetical protein